MQGGGLAVPCIQNPLYVEPMGPPRGHVGGTGPGAEALTAEPPATHTGEPRQARKGATVSRSLWVIGEHLARAEAPGYACRTAPDGGLARTLLTWRRFREPNAKAGEVFALRTGSVASGFIQPIGETPTRRSVQKSLDRKGESISDTNLEPPDPEWLKAALGEMS